MAWGLFHGMKPYVDAIDMNWPGIVLVHVFAYKLAGVAPWGLRAVDLFCQFIGLAGTMYLLAAWRVPRAMRLLAGSAFLMTYLATGWWWTAQRESFNWPLWIIGAMPFLLTLGPTDRIQLKHNPATWLACGMISGLSLWIKPTPALALGLVVLLSLIVSKRGDRKSLMGGIAIFVLGQLLVVGLFVLWLAAMGALGGFLKWGIFYAFGAYSKSTWPWPVRIIRTFRTAITPQYRPLTVALALSGSIAVLVNAAWRRDALYRWRLPILSSLLLIFTGAMTAMLQGKVQCVYHFIPMRWTIALFAAVIWSVLPWNRAMGIGAWVLSIGAMIVTVASIHPVGPTPGTAAAPQVKSMLGPSDQVIMWGSSTTLLSAVEHRTPFPIVSASAAYQCTPPGSKYRRELLDMLDAALRDPSVKLLLVEQGEGYAMQRTPEKPAAVLQADPMVSRTIQEQYILLPPRTVGGFDTYLHTTTEK